MRAALIILGLCSCLCLPQARAGLFGEHKRIGDLSFIQFIGDLHLSSFFRDSLQFRQYGIDYGIPFSHNTGVMQYYQGMFGISDGAHTYSYGDLCGLSGDHTVDVMQLFEGLYSSALFTGEPPSEKYKGLTGKLFKVDSLQHEAIDQYKLETSYLYASYILLANEDRSHFQRPPLSVGEMLAAIDFPLIELLDSLATNAYDAEKNGKDLTALRVRIAKRFLHLNNTAKYAILHLLALDCMNSSATAYCNGDEIPFIRYFKVSLVFNAFADHFLQDAFAAGHIPVIRSIRGLDNKGVHDYYCRTGLNVRNERGERWHTYGDGYYDSATYAHAIQADVVSITELWDYFNEVRNRILVSGEYPLSLFEELTVKGVSAGALPKLLIAGFKCYAYEPLPYDADGYRDSIALKRGSKNGAYADIGVFSLPGKAQGNLGFNGELSLISFNLTDYAKIAHPKPGRETKYWVGGLLAFDYSVIKIDSSIVYTLGSAIDFSIWDRWIASLDVGVIHRNSSYFLLRPMIGYEIKALRSSLAPSIRCFYDISALQLTKFGILFSLRIY